MPEFDAGRFKKMVRFWLLLKDNILKNYIPRFCNTRKKHEELQYLFYNAKPKNKEFLYTYENPAFAFRDESWEHIKTFITSNETYCWDLPHNSDISRIKRENGNIEIISLRKANNWNCLFFRKFARYDFELSFNFHTKTKLDEVQISFNCLDLCRRCRFMIRKCETAVFEVVDNGIFHNYIKQTPFIIDTDRDYSVKIVKIKNHYSFYVDGECLISVEDNSNIKFGADIAIIFYNRSDENDVDISVSGLKIKTDVIPKTKVGILTYHRAQNYGAFLQAYCLYKKISEIDDFDCEIIDYRTVREKETYFSCVEHAEKEQKYFYKKQYEMFNHSADSDVWKLSRDGIVSDSINAFNDYADGKYDIIICGSDEIWRASSYRGFPTAYWLWGNLHAKKIACAVSISDGLSALDVSAKTTIRDNLKSFRYISCREQYACEELAKLTDKAPEFLCDPTFTYRSPIEYNHIIRQKTKITNGRKNVLVMLEPPENEPIAAKIKADLGDKYNLISMFRYQKGYINIDVGSPFEWAEIIKEADFVITNLYHGTVFSIISNTPFLSICTDNKKIKLLSLIKGRNYLEKRFLTYPESLYRKNIGVLIEELSDMDCKEYVEQNRRIFDEFTEAIKHISEET